jgi:hypothetical protein
VFDDDFTTVPAISTELFRNQQFERLYETNRERYIDPSDAGARQDLDDDELEPPSHLLGDEWLTSSELEQRRALQEASSDAINDAVNPVPDGLEGAVHNDSEGAVVVDSEGAEQAAVDDSEGALDEESEGEAVGGSDGVQAGIDLPPKPPDSPPALRTRFRRNESRP